MEYGLTDRGFIVKPFEKILEEQKEDFRAIFGEGIDLSPESVAGAYCYNQAIKLSQMWEELGNIYSMGDINTATGIHLDRLASFLNVERISASNTTVQVALWGNDGTNIPRGNLLKDSNEKEYSLKRPVTISSEKAIGVEFKVLSDKENDVVELKINDTIISYTIEANLKKVDVRDKVWELIQNTFPNTFTKEKSKDEELRIHSSNGIQEFNYSIVTEDTIEIKKVASLGVYDCTEPGPNYVGVGQLNQIVTTLSGLDSAINYLEGQTGKNAESDDDFRTQIKYRQKNASGNEVAIANAVRKLDDVEYAKTYSNRDIIEDSEGRPPKSYEVVVIGGKDEDIAKEIFNIGPAGIQPFGNTNVEIIDSEGMRWNIGFSRPENKFIWIDITYSMNDEEVPNNNIPESIRNNIMGWAIDNLQVGIDLIYQKLFTPIYQVQGIKDVTIKIAVTDNLTKPEPSEYRSADVIIKERELALIDSSRIDVELV